MYAVLMWEENNGLFNGNTHCPPPPSLCSQDAGAVLFDLHAAAPRATRSYHAALRETAADTDPAKLLMVLRLMQVQLRAGGDKRYLSFDLLCTGRLLYHEARIG